MQNLLDSIEEVKRTKGELEQATAAMHKASAAHQEAVKKASELKREFDASIADLVPSTRLQKAG